MDGPIAYWRITQSNEGEEALVEGLSSFTSSEVVAEALARCTPVGGVFIVQSDAEMNNPFG